MSRSRWATATTRGMTRQPFSVDTSPTSPVQETARRKIAGRTWKVAVALSRLFGVRRALRGVQWEHSRAQAGRGKEREETQRHGAIGKAAGLAAASRNLQEKQDKASSRSSKSRGQTARGVDYRRAP